MEDHLNKTLGNGGFRMPMAAGISQLNKTTTSFPKN
jgi:hypothetical protein